MRTSITRCGTTSSARASTTATPSLRTSRSSQATAGRGPQEVVEAVDRPDLALGSEVLELELDRGQDLGGDQFGELPLPEEAAQQVAVESQGGGPALGDGSVGLVEEGGDEGEEQRRGERRGRGGLDLDDPDACAI